MIKTFYATALIYWFVLNSLILHEIVFDLSVTEVTGVPNESAPQNIRSSG